MKVMITGANGFVGYYLLQEIEKAGDKVIAIIRNKDSNIEKLKDFKNVKIIYCDMNHYEDLPALVSDRDIDCCIHLAWDGATGAKRGDYNVQLNNVKSSIDLCNALSEMSIRRFIGIGSLAEKDVSYYISADGATPNLTSCYGTAKITADYMTKAICSNNGIEHIWCQLSNIYGVGDKTNNFVKFACETMLQGKRAAFTEGNQIYDFIYISDVAKAIYLVAKNGKKNTTYFIGSGKARKLKEYIKLMRDIIDKKIELYLGEIPFNGVSLPEDVFDCEKIKNDTGFEATVSFEEGIRKTISWLKENNNG